MISWSGCWRKSRRHVNECIPRLGRCAHPHTGQQSAKFWRKEPLGPTWNAASQAGAGRPKQFSKCQKIASHQKHPTTTGSYASCRYLLNILRDVCDQSVEVDGPPVATSCPLTSVPARWSRRLTDSSCRLSHLHLGGGQSL